MSSQPSGTRIGPYILSDKLGEGGMGEVYRATDTKLKRDVAIKLLPEAFTRDPDRLARFDREAQVLAQLLHPNIASIFGVEETGGSRALVMELVEGPTLGERLEQKRLQLDESLAIALQIAEALEAAHAKGIVHRDLKPANIKLTAEGQVKVLDFGLAKALDPGSDSGVSQPTTLANSPTLTSAGTRLGVILGTASYMSPEQARGKAIDRRSDVWSFGVVLYEMITTRRLFDGEMVSDVLAGVLKGEIDLDAVPTDTPPAIRRLLRRCLERNPRNRLHDIADARIVLQEVLSGEDRETLVGPERRRGLAGVMGWLVAAVALMALGIALTMLLPNRNATRREAYALSLAPPPGGQLQIAANSGWGAISPDGSRIVVRASTPDGTGLWLRSLDREDGRLLPGTEEGFYPFWSPDGRWVAFFCRGLLQRVEVEGGLPEKICVAPWGRGGSWAESGRILITPVGGGAIHVVDAAGGDPRPVTRVEHDAGEDAHYWPLWLPDGEHFLYFIRSGRREDQGIYLGRVRDDGIDDERHRVVASSSSGLFVPAAGRAGKPMLLWAQDGAILARELDLASGALAGPTSRIAEDVRVLESQRALMASVSNEGTLTWATTRFGKQRVGTYRRDGSGPELLRSVPAGDLFEPRWSPDGRWVSFVMVEGGQGDIWMLDQKTGELRPRTSTASYEEEVVWSPDSREILFQRGGTESQDFQRMPADGSESPKAAFSRSGQGRLVVNADAWLPGGWIVVEVDEGDGSHDLGMIQLDDPSTIHDLVAGPGDQFGAKTSPDGGVLAYRSDESGNLDTYVVSLALRDGRPTVVSNRQRIARDRVLAVAWTRAGRELDLVTATGEVFAVPIDLRDNLPRLGDAVKLFDLTAASELSDLSVDPAGDRFLVPVDPEAEFQSLSVLLNWPARLQPR